jgi:hypothetical protein
MVPPSELTPEQQDQLLDDAARALAEIFVAHWEDVHAAGSGRENPAPAPRRPLPATDAAPLAQATGAR